MTRSLADRLHHRGAGRQTEPSMKWAMCLIWIGAAWVHLGCVSSVASAPFSISTDPGHHGRPDIFGNWVVWHNTQTGSIHASNLSSGERRQISDSGTACNARIWGKRIVWQDRRNGDWDIYLYELDSGRERPLVIRSGNQVDPDIDAGTVVWREGQYPDWSSIWAYSLSTDQVFRISQASGNKWRPAVSGNLVVWGDYRNGNWDIYAYDLHNAREFAVATGPAYQRSASVSGNTIVYQNFASYEDPSAGLLDSVGIYDVQQARHMYHALDADCDWLALHNGIVVWGDYRHEQTTIYGHEIASGREFLIGTLPGWQYCPSIYGNVVVWGQAGGGSAATRAIVGTDIDIDTASVYPEPGLDLLSVTMAVGKRAEADTPDTPPLYNFNLSIETSAAIQSVTFETPGGQTFTMSESFTPSETAYSPYDGTTEIRSWTHDRSFSSAAGLQDYGDGTYVVTSYNRNGTQTQTLVPFSIPGSSAAIPQPVQIPTLTSHSSGDNVASPLLLMWQACTDPSVTSISLELANESTQQRLSRTFATGITVSDLVELTAGTWTASLCFDRWYAFTNEEGVSISVGKYTAYDSTVRITVNDLAPVYRAWSPTYQRHFYTIQYPEMDKLLSHPSGAWQYEGIAYRAYSSEARPGLMGIHRFYSASLNTHFYTIVPSERDKLTANYAHVWTYEGTGFYAFPEGSQPEDTSPVYRFWSATLGYHFFTLSDGEKNKLIDEYAHVWTYEGIAWYAYRP